MGLASGASSTAASAGFVGAGLGVVRVGCRSLPHEDMINAMHSNALEMAMLRLLLFIDMLLDSACKSHRVLRLAACRYSLPVVSAA